MKENNLPLPIPQNKKDLDAWLDLAGEEGFGVNNILRALDKHKMLPRHGSSHRRAIGALIKNEPPTEKAQIMELLGAISRTLTGPELESEKGKSDLYNIGDSLLRSALARGNQSWVGVLLNCFPETLPPIINSWEADNLRGMISGGKMDPWAEEGIFKSLTEHLLRADLNELSQRWRVNSSLKSIESILLSRPGTLESISKTKQVMLLQVLDQHTGGGGFEGVRAAFELQKARENRRQLAKRAGKIRLRAERKGALGPDKPGLRM